MKGSSGDLHPKRMDGALSFHSVVLLWHFPIMNAADAADPGSHQVPRKE
jgi:hypothetical protein